LQWIIEAGDRFSYNRAMKTLLARLLLAASIFSGASVKADEAVLHACMIDQEPWGSLSGPGSGIYAEVFDAIGKAVGRPVDITVGPLARTLDNVRTGICQFTITSWHSARANKLTLGATLAAIDYGMLPRRGFTPAHEADLRQHDIAVVRGLLLGSGFDEDGAVRKVGVYGYEQAVRMTVAGRVDGAAGSIMTLRWFARRHGTTEAFGPPLVLTRVDLAVQKNIGFAATPAARAVDEAVAHLRDSGQADEIIARHFGG